MRSLPTVLKSSPCSLQLEKVRSKAELSTDPWNSISQCALGAQCGERPIEDWLCQAGKSPTWVFGEGLYPVPLKQDELGHECRPEALYPIYAAVLAGF